MLEVTPTNNQQDENAEQKYERLLALLKELESELTNLEKEGVGLRKDLLEAIDEFKKSSLLKKINSLK